MIRYTSERQLPLAGFTLPFGGKLNPKNRWVKLSHRIPWDELATGYHKKMNADRGRPAKNGRLVIGAVIIKHKLNLSDEETVLQIQENPYLQYFVGLSRIKKNRPLPQVCLLRFVVAWAVRCSMPLRRRYFPRSKGPVRKRVWTLTRNPRYQLQEQVFAQTIKRILTTRLVAPQ